MKTFATIAEVLVLVALATALIGVLGLLVQTVRKKARRPWSAVAGGSAVAVVVFVILGTSAARSVRATNYENVSVFSRARCSAVILRSRRTTRMSILEARSNVHGALCGRAAAPEDGRPMRERSGTDENPTPEATAKIRRLPDPDVILTPDEAAALLDIPRKTVTAMCAEGRLEGAFKAGRQWRILGSAVRKLARVR